MVDLKKAAQTPQPSPTPAVSFDKLAAVYIKMRDKKTEMKRAFDEEEAKLKAKMNKIEIAMLQQLTAMDMNSVRTDHGTIIRQEEILPTGSDWGLFYDWVKENDAFDALERRIKKTFVKEYMESHEGAVPPGVSVMREYVVRVRRNS
jgi:hypothetical protein